jgi:hypothetical protein
MAESAKKGVGDAETSYRDVGPFTRRLTRRLYSRVVLLSIPIGTLTCNFYAASGWQGVMSRASLLPTHAYCPVDVGTRAALAGKGMGVD